MRVSHSYMVQGVPTIFIVARNLVWGEVLSRDKPMKTSHRVG